MAGVRLHQLGLRKGELTFSHLFRFLELEPPGAGGCSPTDVSELSQRWAAGSLGNGCAILLVAVGYQDCETRI